MFDSRGIFMRKSVAVFHILNKLWGDIRFSQELLCCFTFCIREKVLMTARPDEQSKLTMLRFDPSKP